VRDILADWYSGQLLGHDCGGGDQVDQDGGALREFADGVAFWYAKRWGDDFNNAEYEQWARANPHGHFTLEWWEGFLPTLHRWRATRPFSGAELTTRFRDGVAALNTAWQTSCAPYLGQDISTVTWEQVEAFPTEVANIKPTKSPVFTSKVCHFLLPKVFPVVDNEALGNRWPTYEAYFRAVQEIWAETDPEVQEELVSVLRKLIESASSVVFTAYPMINKIVELRLIGQNHQGLQTEATAPSLPTPIAPADETQLTHRSHVTGKFVTEVQRPTLSLSDAWLTT